MILFVLACATADAERTDTADPCADAPYASWESFGAGFLTESCQTCHAASSPDRHGAPENVTFDTAADAWSWAERILVTTLGEAPTMPPQGGLDDADKVLLDAWLTCGTPGA